MKNQKIGDEVFLYDKKVIPFMDTTQYAADGSRTHMVSRTILSRVRLPIPPQRLILIISRRRYTPPNWYYINTCPLYMQVFFSDPEKYLNSVNRLNITNIYYDPRTLRSLDVYFSAKKVPKAPGDRHLPPDPLKRFLKVRYPIICKSAMIMRYFRFY